MTCSLPSDDGRISILEKVARLTEVLDPSLMPIDLIQFYASNLGYSVGLNRDDITSFTSELESDPANKNKYIRFMVSQLPEWYQVKTSRPSVQVMLYSFGLVGDLVYYYTNSYASSESSNNEDKSLAKFNQVLHNGGYSNFKEIYSELCKLKYNVDLFRKNVASWVLTEWDSTSIKENPMNIPDDFFPTPHFRLWFDILQSMSSLTYSTDLNRHERMVVAINSIRPINTVFEGMIAAMTVNANVYRGAYIRLCKNISIVSDVPADAWYVPS